MRKFLFVLLIMIVVLGSSFTFQVGFFEYPTGAREYAMFSETANVGKFEFGITHWIFIRIYDLFNDNPNSFVPFLLESSGGIWDVWAGVYLMDNVFLFVKHRSVHNFDGIQYFYDSWHNFYGIEVRW